MSAPAAGEISRVTVELGPRRYQILIGSGLIAAAGRHLRPLLRRPRVAVITDATVAGLHLDPLLAALGAAGIEAVPVILPPGEESKGFARLEGLLDALLAARIARDEALVALGGGVIGDLVGFAASILRRGVPFVQVPTTLLAQVDSSVGGKTGVNTRHGKNLVGTFHQPLLVLADTLALGTLPRRELLAGYAEVVKYGLIDDAPFFAWLEREGEGLVGADGPARRRAVEQSCRHKARIVARDEREEGDRALLNLGHTFAHAFEAEAGYAQTLLHGEAVALGLVLAAELAVRLGHSAPAERERIQHHLAKVGLPTRPAQLGAGTWQAARLIERMAQDKKVQDGRVAFVLLRGIGGAFLARDVELETVQALLTDAIAGRGPFTA